jgi:serine/threonine protein kinase
MVATIVADRFELSGEVGAGGMGVVYRARDRATGADVALKMMLRSEDPGDVARFTVLASLDALEGDEGAHVVVEREQRALLALGNLWAATNLAVTVAKLARARGRMEDFRARAHEAMELAERCGNTRVVEDVRALMEENDRAR